MNRPLKYLRIFLQTWGLTFFAFAIGNYFVNYLTTLDNFDLVMLLQATLFFGSILSMLFILYLEFFIQVRWFRFVPMALAWLIVITSFAFAFIIDPQASAEGPMSISTFAVIICSTIFYGIPPALVITIMVPFGISQLEHSHR